MPVLDPDLTFAAYTTPTYRGQLHSLRKDIVGRLKELHRRWRPVSSRLRHFQTSSKGSGQWAFRVLNELLGTPFSDDMRQLMAATGTFLGLDFDMTAAMSHGEVAFFVRERLVSKVSDLVAPILDARTLRAGLLNFLELGMFGRVGAGGLQAIKERQLQRGGHHARAHVQLGGRPDRVGHQAAAQVPAVVAR